jgi:hypothetical protein
VTRTTTYTFANGGTNPVVDTVAAIPSTPTLTAAVYPSDWTTVGTVSNPSVSTLTNTYGDGTVTTLESGTSLLPFNQSTLLAQSITDPSAIVRSSTTDYNLIWGVPDKDGPAYAGLFPSSISRLSSNLNIYAVTVSGQGVTGPALVQPSADVLSAWNSGWTGKGKSILTIDNYSLIGSCSSASTCHGVTTMLISDLIAPGATKYGANWDFTTGANNLNRVSAGYITPDVVNMSFGTNSAGSINAITYLTDTDINNTRYLNISFNSAVLIKSAGNNSGQDTYSYTAAGDYFVKGLVDNSNTSLRLLIVGALDKNGSIASPATIASYSNVAGTTSAAQNRFVVANGNAPFANGGVSMNGSAIAGYETNMGTSYAAPVVAGYAAIVRSKFPNLNAEKTSSIILDTARYDTLSCYPSCSVAIYGKGEASLSRALAPVGRLR